ncbi:MAG: hypothetical protein KH811_09875, partial [Veillonella sp.]|nr:hypothetical protein [Veillonella sp.]
QKVKKVTFYDVRFAQQTKGSSRTPGFLDDLPAVTGSFFAALDSFNTEYIAPLATVPAIIEKF